MANAANCQHTGEGLEFKHTCKQTLLHGAVKASHRYVPFVLTESQCGNIIYKYTPQKEIFCLLRRNA